MGGGLYNRRMTTPASARPVGLASLAGLDAEHRVAAMLRLAARLTSGSPVADHTIELGLAGFGATVTPAAVARVRELLDARF